MMLKIVFRWLLAVTAVAALAWIFWRLSADGANIHVIPTLYLKLEYWWMGMPIAAVVGVIYGFAELVALTDESVYRYGPFLVVFIPVFVLFLIADIAAGLSFAITIGLIMLVSKRVRNQLRQWFWPK